MKISKEVRTAFELLIPLLGKPSRGSLDEDNNLRTVMGLVHRFEEGPGYTGNPYRGEHLSIPGWDENGGLVILEVSFHKGTTHTDLVHFTGREGSEVYQAAVHLLGFPCPPFD